MQVAEVLIEEEYAKVNQLSFSKHNDQGNDQIMMASQYEEEAAIKIDAPWLENILDVICMAQ